MVFSDSTKQGITLYSNEGLSHIQSNSGRTIEVQVQLLDNQVVADAPRNRCEEISRGKDAQR